MMDCSGVWRCCKVLNRSLSWQEELLPLYPLPWSSKREDEKQNGQALPRFSDPNIKPSLLPPSRGEAKEYTDSSSPWFLQEDGQLKLFL